MFRNFYEGESAVRTGFAFCGIGPTNANAAPYSYGTVPSHPGSYLAFAEYSDSPQADPILAVMRGCVWDVGYRNIRHILKYGSGDSPIVPYQKIMVDDPDNTSYRGGDDWALYGSRISTLRNVQHRSGLTRDPSATREKNCVHANYAGIIQPTSQAADTLGYIDPVTAQTAFGFVFSDRQLVGINHPTLLRLAPPRTKVRVSNAGITQVFTCSQASDELGSNTSYPEYPFYYLADMIEEWLLPNPDHFQFQNPVSIQGRNGFSQWRFVTGFRCSGHDVPGQDVYINYTLKCEWYYSSVGFPSYVTESWDITHHLSVGDLVEGASQSGTGVKEIRSRPQIEWTYSWTPNYKYYTAYDGSRRDVYITSGSRDMYVSGNDYPKYCIISKPTADGGTGISALTSFLDKGIHWKTLGRANANISLLTPASYYSSADALEKFMEVISNNWLETLTELGDLVSLLPDLGLLLKAYRDVRSLRVDGLLRLGDFIADTYLKYQFGVAPDAAAVKELNEQGPRFMDSLGAIIKSNGNTIYGQYVYDLIEGPYSDHPSSMIVRSKLRIRMTDEAFLRTLVGLKAAGLLPSLSPLWEILPGSFIIDWFTNMNRRLKDIDTQFFMMCVDVQYAVHSYTIFEEVPSDLLSTYALESVGVPFASKAFIRHISMVMPSLRFSPFDFRGSSPQPSAGVGGSLAWGYLTR
jgi:hypothetical protein